MRHKGPCHSRASYPLSIDIDTVLRSVDSDRESHGLLASKARDIQDRLGEGLRGFLWQIVANSALGRSVRILAGEFPSVRVRLWMWRAIGVTFKSDGGHRDGGTRGKALFQFVILRLALGQPESPAIIVDHDADVIWVVERCSGTIEGRIIEIPFR